MNVPANFTHCLAKQSSWGFHLERSNGRSNHPDHAYSAERSIWNRCSRIKARRLSDNTKLKSRKFKIVLLVVKTREEQSHALKKILLHLQRRRTVEKLTRIISEKQCSLWVSRRWWSARFKFRGFPIMTSCSVNSIFLLYASIKA